jgi:uncharacterized membrane protein (DUF106 family)
MLQALNSICVSGVDLVLGWMLRLPRDVALCVVATCTAGVLASVRLIVTNQDLLKRCRQDKGRLKELVRAAKRNGDKEALARHRTSLRQIGTMTLRAEGKPLLVSVPVIALLAVWCFSRIAYLPVKPREPVLVKAYFPVSGIGDLVHILPQDGLQAKDGWVQEVKEDRDPSSGRVTNGVASWVLSCEERGQPYGLLIRYMGKAFARPLVVDGLHYAAPLQSYGADSLLAAQTVLSEYRPFGIVPGIPQLMLQPWVVGYLVVVIPLTLLSKRLLGIY